MKIQVSDREHVERGILVRTRYAVISIRDPHRRNARIPQTTGLAAILRLAFDDAEPSAGFSLPPNVVLMTSRHAIRIWAFVEQQRATGIETLIVHCEQGMSRSPAVAAAVCVVHGEPAGHFFSDYQPNRHVYETMLANRVRTTSS